MGRLDTITVHNLKSIRELELSQKPLNIFIGENGGKSNFIGVFKFLNQIVERNLQTYTASGGENRILYFDRKKSESLSFALSFTAGVTEYECTLNPTAKNKCVLSSESFCSDPGIRIGIGGNNKSELSVNKHRIRR